MVDTESSERADDELWEAIYRLLLSAVCEIEKHKWPERPTTSDLRKAGKKVIKVDVKQE